MEDSRDSVGSSPTARVGSPLPRDSLTGVQHSSKRSELGSSGGQRAPPSQMRRSGTVKKMVREEGSFAESLAKRPVLTLGQQFGINDVPEPVIEWSMKAFSLFDATCKGELDPWEIKEALISSGKATVSDDLVFQMIQQIGKVHHAEVKVNFKEFVGMCFDNFFKPKVDSDDKRDVKEAFLILGGGEEGDGQVSVDKLKEFTQSTELTIDIDKLVAEVDDDGSGQVDFGEFCQLFEDRLGDTNLHDTGEHWLRNESADFGIIPGKRSRPKTPDNIIIDPDIEDKSKITTPGGQKATGSRPGSQAASNRMNTGGRRSPEIEEFGLRGPAAPRQRRATGVLPLLERKVSNISGGKCRRGWKFSNLRYNIPGHEGYNEYNIKTLNFKDLGSMVKMRTRGAEFTIREHASERLDKRLPTELRLQKLIRSSSRVNSPTSQSLNFDNMNRARTSTRASSRQSTRSGSQLLEKRGVGQHSELIVGASDTSDRAIRTIAHGLVVNVDSPSQPKARPVRSSQNAYRDRPWTMNMKRPVTAPPTEELLKSAASVGLYAGMGVKEVGPGISFFDDS